MTPDDIQKLRRALVALTWGDEVDKVDIEEEARHLYLLVDNARGNMTIEEFLAKTFPTEALP